MVITLRNLPPELQRRLETEARRNRSSLARTACAILERGLGLQTPTATEHHDLDWMFGTWSEEEAAEFDRSLASQRTVEKKLWR